MTLHIFTLTWQGINKLKALKPGLEKNLEISGVDYTWHIRDNGSTDGTLDETESWDAKVYDVGHNRDSFAKGMNYLAYKSNLDDEDLILLLNNDIIFNDDISLSKMIKLQNKTKADVVGSRLMYNNSNFLQHAGVIFGKRYGSMPYHYRHKEVCDDFDRKNRYFQAVTAACCLITAKSFKKVGGLNESFFWAFEDIALCLDIGQLKPNNIVYCGETNIYHEESATLKKNPVNKIFLSGNVNTFKKYYSKKYHLDHDFYLNDKKYRLISTANMTSR